MLFVYFGCADVLAPYLGCLLSALFLVCLVCFDLVWACLRSLFGV